MARRLRQRFCVWHSPCQEQPDDLHRWAVCRQYRTRRPKVRPRCQQVVDNRNYSGFRNRQRLVDSVSGLDLLGSGAHRLLVHCVGALRLDDQFAHVCRLAWPNGAEHSCHSIIVKRIAAGLRRRHGHEHVWGWILAQCAPERGGRLNKRRLLVWPLEFALAVERLLEVQDQLIGLAVRVAFASCVLT